MEVVIPEILMANDILKGNARKEVIDDFWSCYFEEYGDLCDEDTAIKFALRYSTHCLKIVKNFTWR